MTLRMRFDFTFFSHIVKKKIDTLESFISFNRKVKTQLLLLMEVKLALTFGNLFQTQ